MELRGGLIRPSHASGFGKSPPPSLLTAIWVSRGQKRGSIGRDAKIITCFLALQPHFSKSKFAWPPPYLFSVKKINWLIAYGRIVTGLPTYRQSRNKS